MNWDTLARVYGALLTGGGITRSCAGYSYPVSMPRGGHAQHRRQALKRRRRLAARSRA